MNLRTLSTLQRNRGPLLGLAAFTAVALLLTSLVAGTLMKGVSGETDTYTAIFTDTTGLVAGDDVRIAGVEVGSVEKIELVDNHAKVTFTLHTNQRLDAGSSATIDYLNLMGQRYIALAGTPGAKALPAGSTIPLERTDVGLDLTALFNAFKPVFDLIKPADINALATNLIKTLQGEGPTIRDLTKQVADLTGTLASRDEVIGTVIDNLSTVMGTLQSHRTQITSLVHDLDRLTGTIAANDKQLGATIDSVEQAVTTFNGVLQEGADNVNADVDSLAAWANSFEKHTGELKDALFWAQDLVIGYIKTLGAGSYLNTYVCDSSFQVLGGGPAIPLLKPGQGGQTSARCQR